MTDFIPVTFNAGTPIDINDLNRLQSNISSVQKTQESNVVNATIKVGAIEKTVQVIPIIFAGTKQITISTQSKRGDGSIDFSGANFTQEPIVVASIKTNTKPSDQATLNVRATSKTGGILEVLVGKDSILDKVDVDFIAVQMQPKN